MAAEAPPFLPSSPWWCALHLREPSLDGETRHRAAQQAWLAGYAYGFSAEVSLREPDTVLFEAGRSLGLFGPWPRWQQRLRDELAACEVQVRIACAPTPLAARCFALAHDGLAIADAAQSHRLLARLPLALAGLPDDALRLLERSGFRRLGDVLALPRAALARRIGPSALSRIDRMTGAAPDPLPLYAPPQRYAARLDFDHAIADSTVLLFPLRRLLQEFALFLLRRDGGVPAFRVVFGHEGHAPTVLEVRLAAPEREFARLFDLARLKLDSARLPAPAVSLGLEADDLPDFIPERRDLFDAPRSGDAGLLESRLRARLGDAAVQRLAVVDTHRPEAAWCYAKAPRTRLPALADGPRPLWLIDPPIVLRDAVDAVLAGPERIETAWWDDEPVRRDYYRLRTRSGQEAWAFRPAGGEGGPWWLHGWFA